MARSLRWIRPLLQIVLAVAVRSQIWMPNVITNRTDPIVFAVFAAISALIAAETRRALWNLTWMDRRFTAPPHYTPSDAYVEFVHVIAWFGAAGVVFEIVRY